jgi:hypothetical protein
MWKNTVESGRPQKTKWRLRIACWIPKAISTRSEYVIVTALPLQQWLHKCGSMLRLTYTACLLMFPRFPQDLVVSRSEEWLLQESYKDKERRCDIAASEHIALQYRAVQRIRVYSGTNDNREKTPGETTRLREEGARICKKWLSNWKETCI